MSLRFGTIADIVAEESESVALVTLISVSGSSPQNAGAKMVVSNDGRTFGTIGGGFMEAEAKRLALICLRQRESHTRELHLDNEFECDDEPTCGGTVRIHIAPLTSRSLDIWRSAAAMQSKGNSGCLCISLSELPSIYLTDASGTSVASTIEKEPPIDLAGHVVRALESYRTDVTVMEDGTDWYIEPILPRPKLVVCGAGHIGAAISRIASLCDFDVTVVDDRPSFASRENLPDADNIVVEEIHLYVRNLKIDDLTYIVIVTRDHKHDAQTLLACIHSTAKYIGMIGSKRKIRLIYDEMIGEGTATANELQRIYSPIGLNINSKDVGEIAVSIMAEIIAVRRGATINSIRSLSGL